MFCEKEKAMLRKFKPLLFVLIALVISGSVYAFAAGNTVEDSAGGMGITWGHYNRDGFMEAFVSNMRSSAGLRFTNQSRFKPNASDEDRRRFRHFAEGNTLMRNSHDGTFQKRTNQAGVEMGRWAWGNLFFDLNNDGWEDLVVANGYLTTDDSGDL